MSSGSGQHAGFGPHPRQQGSWDVRAATNFMAGGAGSGLIFTHAFAGGAALWPWLVGGALIGLGLFAVWLEIGRPLRAMNVFRHPGRSWMTREAIAASVLFALLALALVGTPGAAWGAGLAAAVFAYCQARMVLGARGIATWREPRVVPLLLATSLADGAGLYVLVSGSPRWVAAGLLAAALAVRIAAWTGWRQRLRGSAPERALAEVDRAGHVFNGTSLLALAACVVAALSPPLPTAPAVAWLWPLAGALALAGGLWFKATLVVRAAYTQGFTLPHLPVRGVRRG
ncbi:MAG: dimethyl sulfoxide reductase anchor subunit [Rubrivivax sp.]|nr:dimethyl sulfoxide reductase anchor subunit [Rubrivivax sp.]